MNELREIPPDRYRLLNRSTEGFSRLMYANIIECGSVDEWVLLWRACQTDAETREATICMLSTIDPLQADVIRMWSDMLGVPRPPELGSVDRMNTLKTSTADGVKWRGKDLSVTSAIMYYSGRLHIDPIRGAVHVPDLEGNPPIEEVLHADDYEVEIRVLRRI